LISTEWLQSTVAAVPEIDVTYLMEDSPPFLTINFVAGGQIWPVREDFTMQELEELYRRGPEAVREKASRLMNEAKPFVASQLVDALQKLFGDKGK
jgi:hypothetical protein